MPLYPEQRVLAVTPGFEAAIGRARVVLEGDEETRWVALHTWVLVERPSLPAHGRWDPARPLAIEFGSYVNLRDPVLLAGTWYHEALHSRTEWNLSHAEIVRRQLAFVRRHTRSGERAQGIAELEATLRRFQMEEHKEQPTPRHPLASRKFWLAVFTALGLLVAHYTGLELPTEALVALAVTVATYILGEAAVDAARARSGAPQQPQSSAPTGPGVPAPAPMGPGAVLDVYVQRLNAEVLRPYLTERSIGREEALARATALRAEYRAATGQEMPSFLFIPLEGADAAT